MSKAILYYDGNCVICNNYVRLLRRKVNSLYIDFVPGNPENKDFQFVSMDGKVYYGEKAIDMLTIAFPAVKTYFWMLPDKYKLKAVKAAYKIGSAVRKVGRKFGCKCGRR